MTDKRVTKSNIDKTEIYVNKAKAIHGENKYDYSLLKNIRKRECRVDIICPRHGIFNISLHKHICGDGCRKCGSETTSKKLSKSKEQFILECKNIHIELNGADIYEYGDLPTYKNRKSLIEYKCIRHNNVVQQKAGYHVGGKTACKKCESEKMSNSISKTTYEFIDQCIKVFSLGIYSYEDTIYKNNKEEVIIKCIKHNNKFLQTPTYHLNSKLIGCEICKEERKKELFKIKKEKYEEQYKEKTKEITKQLIKKNNDEDNLYKSDYSNFIYTSYRSKINVECLKHKCKYKQCISSYLLDKITCQLCKIEKHSAYIKKINEKKMIKIEDCIDKFNDIHENKYEYSNSILIRTEDNRLLIKDINCKIHGLFTQRFDAHIDGRGCKKCSALKVNKILTSITRMSPEEFRRRSQEKYNGKYIIKGLYNNARTPIKIYCKEHNMNFNQVPHSHLIGYSGCPKCRQSKTSKPANDWISLLLVNEPNIQWDLSEDKEYRIPGTNYTVDGYNSLTNTIYEFHGDYWHGNPKLYNPAKIHPNSKKSYGELFKKTLHKELLCRNKGYNYECIWEYEWSNIINSIILIQKLWRKYKKLTYQKKNNILTYNENGKINIILNKNNPNLLKSIYYNKKGNNYIYNKTIKGKKYKKILKNKIDAICYKFIFNLKLKTFNNICNSVNKYKLTNMYLIKNTWCFKKEINGKKYQKHISLIKNKIDAICYKFIIYLKIKSNLI